VTLTLIGLAGGDFDASPHRPGDSHASPPRRLAASQPRLPSSCRLSASHS
jgi:hypothetical protein